MKAAKMAMVQFMNTSSSEDRNRLMVMGTEEDYERIAKTGAVLVHWRLYNMRIEDVQRLQDSGYKLAAWTPNFVCLIAGVIILLRVRK